MIKKENAKFTRKFSTPHTSMYTGVHESIDKILDPKYVHVARTGESEREIGTESQRTKGSKTGPCQEGGLSPSPRCPMSNHSYALLRASQYSAATGPAGQLRACILCHALPHAGRSAMPCPMPAAPP
jgi:hypothetical protein